MNIIDENACIYLCHIIWGKEWLIDNKHLNIKEKMTMFLVTFSHNLRN